MLFFRLSIFLSHLLICLSVHAYTLYPAKRLQQAYPEFIRAVTRHAIIWKDGTYMPLYDKYWYKHPQEELDSPSLADQLRYTYQRGLPTNITTYQPHNDAGRIRYEPFFRKMYGNSEAEVRSHLVTIYWMPKFFGQQYPLKVTTVNHINNKFIQISHDLEQLVSKNPNYLPYLMAPGGTFKWRIIAETKRQSLHSFGMTIDINTNMSDYWQWALHSQHLPIREDMPIIYRNRIPWPIVLIFEKHGFIWGGKWRHFDSMHFEYRPELL